MDCDAYLSRRLRETAEQPPANNKMFSAIDICMLQIFDSEGSVVIRLFQMREIRAGDMAGQNQDAFDGSGALDTHDTTIRR